MKRIPIVEVYLSCVSIWWAVCLFGNKHTILNVPKLLSPFAEFGQSAWASVFLVGAFLKVYGILTEVMWLRKLGLIFSFVLYGLITAGYILSGHLLNPGTGIYFMMTVLALLSNRMVGERNAFN